MSLLQSLDAPDAGSVAAALERTEFQALAVLKAIGAQFPDRPRPAARQLVGLLGQAVDEALPAMELRAGLRASSARELVVFRGAEAALGGWAREFGFALGVLGGTVAALRDVDQRLSPLTAPTGISRMALDIDPLEFYSAVTASLRGLADPLDRIQAGLALDDTALGRLFAVKRQAIAQWRTRGIPFTRRSAVHDIAATVDLLERKLRQGELPLLATKPVEALGGRSLLEALAEDPPGTRRAYEAAFDLAITA